MFPAMAESEDMALNNIDAATAISIEMSNAAPQQLRLAAAAAALRRKQQQDNTQDGSGMMFGQKQRHSSSVCGGVVSGTGQPVEFLDSGDEGGAFDSDGADDDVGSGRNSNAPGANIGVDLFRLRQAKRHHVMG